MYRLDQVCFEPGIAFTRGQISSFFDLATLEGVAAEVGGRLAGFAVGYLAQAGIGSILTLDVAPAHRRLGLGRSLLTELLRRLERAGADGIRLEVDVRNRAAIALYRSFGFRRTGRLADFYGPGLDAFAMVSNRSGSGADVACELASPSRSEESRARRSPPRSRRTAPRSPR